MSSRLKSLELQGYKTFATRTGLLFPSRITSVVGPNGAGKSNVADSIRWVLGEQSYSLLRGRKTEDMIFAGSENRPKASMASVSITFDNEDGWLPIDFSEVSITRRAYRDGQNDYLLNGQRVRLKEISELLAQSGLAERTYTVIGQGLVDAALSLKPDERRRFFEEAAGIGLFRARREESLNRLDATRRNLERVQDILSELEPRLVSLEKQAKRVQEYERIKADLKLLLRDWYGYHWHRLQLELRHAREAHRAQEQRVEEARNKLGEIEKTMHDSRIRLQALRIQLNEWHNISAENHKQSEQISRKLAVLDERQSAMSDLRQGYQNDLLRLEEENQALSVRAEAIKEESERLRVELEEANLQAVESQKKLQQRLAERARVEQIIREIRKSLVSAETRQVQQKAKLDELRNRLDYLVKSKENLHQSIGSQSELINNSEIRVTQTQANKEQADLEFNDVQNEILSIQAASKETEQVIRRIQEDRNRSEGQAARIQAQLEVLFQAEKSFSGLNQGAKYILQNVRDGSLKGNFRPLSGLLEVPGEFEAAIAAVLGEYLDGILLGPSTDLEQTLVLLEKGEKGRAVLLPENLLRNPPEVKYPKVEGIFGKACDLIQYAKEAEQVVSQLLGRVIVVRDRHIAKELVNQIEDGTRLVTLKGEIFIANEAVIAGQDGRAAMIGRPRQKKELQSALEDAKRTIEALSKEILETGKLYKNLQSEVNQKEKDLQRFRQRVSETTQAYQQARMELEQRRQQWEWQSKQLADIDNQTDIAEKNINQVEQEQKATIIQISAINDNLRENIKIIGALVFEELQNQVHHWNTSIAVTNRALQEVKNRLSETQHSVNQNRQTNSGLSNRLSVLEENIKAQTLEKENLRFEENHLRSEIENLQEKLEPAEKELEAQESNFLQDQEKYNSAQQAVSLAERYYSQAQLDLTRQRESLESLRKKIEEDFGLVTFEYSQQMVGQEPLPLGEMVSQLPHIPEISSELEENINRQRSLLRRMGAINPDALNEFTQVQDRYHFLTTQVEDLKQADADLRKVISELDELMKREFRKTFDAVAYEFRHMFTRLFGGGSAQLILTDENNPTETGIDIEARLPGRRTQGLSLLSGGERSLTAVALIFSLLKVSPTPFCVLDEVDAALDESNVGRFCELLVELSEQTQFLVITHNRNTVQTAGVIYGVTMGRDSVSQLVSLRLDEVDEEMAN